MEMASSPRTVEEIFKDYSARRGGIVRALTQGAVITPFLVSNKFLCDLLLVESESFLFCFDCVTSQMLTNFMGFVIQVTCNCRSRFGLSHIKLIFLHALFLFPNFVILCELCTLELLKVDLFFFSYII